MTDKGRASYAFGPFYLDSTRRTLMREGVLVSLTPKVFDTLVILIENNDRVVEKGELMQAIWPDSYVEERNLAQNVFTLRKALGEDKYIETVPKRGYRFAADVRQVISESEDLIVAKRVTSRVVIEEATDQKEIAPGETDAGALSERTSLRRSVRRPLMALVVLTLLGVLVGVYFLLAREPAGIRSIAVLPFKPIVPSESYEYLGPDRKSTRLNSSHSDRSRMPSSA